MKNIARNANLKENPKTTISGAMLFLLGIVLLISDIWDLTPNPIEWYIWVPTGIIGLWLIVSPDTAISLGKKYINKKIDQN
jgi:hypothetical protein